MVTISAIQLTATPDVKANLAQAEQLIDQAAQQGAKIVVLPEMFCYLGGTTRGSIEIAEQENNGPIQEFLYQQAEKHHIWIVGGTLPIRHKDKAYAASLVINPQGKIAGRYDKLHLFDAALDKGKEQYRESDYTHHGNHICVVDTDYGRLGVCVCYDLRFPELFRIFFQEKVDFIAIPSAFAYTTGVPHWEILLRARAIENASFIIASNQVGRHSETRFTYGHSMLISPWGTILDMNVDKIGVVTSEMDLEHAKDFRKNIPIDKHQRIKVTTDLLIRAF